LFAAGVGNICPDDLELPQALANLAEDKFAFGLTSMLASVL